MRVIKTENPAVCHGCLSSNRETSALGVFAELLLNLIGDQKQTIFCTMEDVRFCWECMAVLKKLKSFQNQLRNAQTALMQMETLCDQDFSPMTLSKLETIEKNNYDQDYQYFEETNQNGTLLNIEESKDNAEANITDCTKIIKEEEYTEFDYIDNKSDQSESSNDITKFHYEYQIEIPKTAVKNDSELQINLKSENDCSRKRKLDVSSDEDFCPGDMNNDEVSPKNVQAKRSKPKKTESKYKHAMTVIKKEKYDSSQVDDYFTMITFGEADYEEHILSKDRNCRSYSRFKYKCKPCERGYNSIFDLKRHNNLNHNKNAEWKCVACKKIVSSLEALEKHWHVHTPVAKCNLCGDVCRPFEMQKHLNKTHTKEYACQYCKMKFGQIFEFIDHYKGTHQKFICDYCNRCCKTKNLLQKHIRSRHNPFVCKKCERKFANKKRLKYHHTVYHPDPTERPELAYCVECNQQFPCIAKYNFHLYYSPKHTNIKPTIPVPCPDCGKIFKKKIYMNNHYNLVHLKKTNHYCELCDKYYAHKSALQLHITEVHMKIKPKNKICDLCGRGFSTNRILLNHRRTHTGERPHQCPFCSAAFIQKQAMRTHCRTQHKHVM